MDKEQKEIIQVTKEIVIKFIETQRISPSNFSELFPAIHRVVQRTLCGDAEQAPSGPTERAAERVK